MSIFLGNFNFFSPNHHRCIFQFTAIIINCVYFKKQNIYISDGKLLKFETFVMMGHGAPSPIQNKTKINGSHELFLSSPNHWCIFQFVICVCVLFRKIYTFQIVYDSSRKILCIRSDLLSSDDSWYP